MKHSILLVALAFSIVSATAQNHANTAGKTTPYDISKPQYTYSVKGLSGSAASLYMDIKQNRKDLDKKHDITTINGEPHVLALVQISDDNAASLAKYGITANTNFKSPFKNVAIPIRSFADFAESGIASYIDLGTRCNIQMDSARYYSHADWAQAGSNGSGITLPKGYCGKDIVVGIIDIGFDYTHRNFWDSTETVYRVKRVWDQNRSGTPPSGFNYGNELTTQANILAALYSHNNQTHGSHVAGIAGGGGTNDTSVKRYKGMAPECDLVLVSTSGHTNRLYDGILYVLNYAHSVGKPCVINLSWGSQIGPHDGTAAIDQNCDYLLDNIYTEGSLIVISASNDGAKPLHINKSFNTTDTLRSFLSTSSGNQQINSLVDIWGEVGNNFSVRLSIIDTTSGQIIASSTLLGTNSSTSGNISISNCSFSYYIENRSSLNNKPHIELDINNSSENSASRYVMIEIIASHGTVHAWASDDYFSSLGFANFTNGNTNHTINAWGQGNEQILVASYNSRHYWKNARNNLYYHYVTATAVGARSTFSSIGPSLNPNRIKPDIAAPGSVIISSYNYGNSASGQNTTAYVPITDSIPNGNHYSLFGAMQGTSMAAPAVSGILALWLEAYPYLTPSQAKYIFQNYSITDSYTGTIPSNGSVYFGRGKIDAFAGLEAILQKTAKPTVTPSRDTAICTGNTVTFTAPAGYAKYYWSNGDTTRTITVSSAGSYCVRAVSTEGFRTAWSDTITVTVKPYVATTKSRDTAICVGQSVNLTVNGGTSRTWSTGQNTTTITVTPANTTTYTVVSNQANQCSTTDTITVTVKPYVATTKSRDTAICIGQSVNLTVNGGTSRTWNTGQNTPTITVTPANTTTYTVVSNQANQCSTTDTITVTVKPYVATTKSRDTAICVGQSVNLTVNGGTSRTWSTGQNTTTITVTPANTTTYTVVSNQANQCSTTDTITVTVKPYVATTKSRDTAICVGQSVNLTVNGGTSRTWSTGQNTSTITVTPANTTTYTVVSNQANQCSTTDTITVTVKPYVATTKSRDTAICIGQSVSLTVNGGTSRTWSTGQNTTTITVTPANTTTYTVVSNQANQCSTTDTITVTVKPYVATTKSRDTAICVGQSVNLTVNGGTSRTWSTGQNTTTITVTPANTTTYTVVSNQANQCFTTDTITVMVKPYVATTKSRDAAICVGQSVNLTVNGGTSRTWSTGQNTTTITVTPANTTTYTVVSNQANLCSTTDTITVTVKPYVATTKSRDTAICVGQSVNLTVNGGTSRTWSTGQNTTTITVTPANTTTYTVVSNQANLCSTTDTITVTVKPYVTTVKSSVIAICSGDTSMLSIAGGTSHSWSTGDTTSTINVAPTTTITYSVITDSVGGCSVTDTFIISPLPKHTSTIYRTICAGGSFDTNGQHYTQTGTYTQKYTDITSGFCSELIINLTVNDTIRDTVYPVLCPGSSVSIGNSLYTYAGTFRQYLRTSGGCDSLLTVIVTVTDTLRDTIRPVICSGGSVTIGNSVYNHAGTFRQYLRTTGGCDSLLTVIVSVTDTLRDTVRPVICSGSRIMIGDSVYNHAGTFRQYLRTSGGCDSLLTVIVTVTDTLRDTVYPVICSGGSARVGDSVYSSAGTYTQLLRTQGGCDSLLTVIVSVTDTIRDTVYPVICSGGSARVGDSVYSSAGTYTQLLRTQGGCDSLLTVIVTVTDTLRDTVRPVICSGGSVTIGNSVYNHAGTFRQYLRTSGGCDSLLTVIVTVTDTLRDTVYPVICSGGSVTIGNSVYNHAGTFRQYLRTSGGCDSLLTVIVSVTDTLRDTIRPVICSGGSARVGDSVYSSAGTYTQLLRTQGGCDSLLTVIVSVTDTIRDTVYPVICSGGSARVGDSVYSSTGTYTQLLRTQGGCDSLLTVIVTVTDTLRDTIRPVICSGGSTRVGDSIYNHAGTFRQYLRTTGGCDSLLTVIVTVTDTLHDTVRPVICSGGSVTIGNSVYNHAGTFRQYLRTNGGCDSLLTVIVTVTDTLRDTVRPIICSGGSARVGDSVYSSAGTYTQLLRTQGGCDSLLTVIVSVTDTIRDTVYPVICSGGSARVGDSVYSSAGTYTQLLRTQGGCDSLLTVIVTVTDTLRDTVYPVICSGGSVTIGDSVYNHAGTFRQYLRTTGGCDSLLTVIVSITDTLRDTVRPVICSGSRIMIGDSVYNHAGTFRQYLRTSGGCDSLLTVIVTVTDTLRDTVYPVICSGGSVTIGDSVYNHAGTFRQYLRTTGGCDSLLTVIVSVTDTLRDTIRPVICPSGSVTVGDSVYSSAGSYTQLLRTQGGCDSLLTIIVSVSDTLRDTIRPVICPSGSVTVGDSVYSTAGTYTQLLRAQGGCDSLLTIIVSVSDTLRDTIRPVICPSGSVTVGDSIYSTAGTYTQLLRAQGGCDSLLTIIVSVSDTLRDTIRPVICEGSHFDTNGISYYNQGVYTQYVGDTTSGCVTKLVIVLTVNPSYSDTIQRTICAGTPITLNALDGISYHWNTGDTTQNIIVQPRTSSIYTAVSDSIGICSKRRTYIVNVTPVVVTYASGATSFCKGNTATLQVMGGSTHLWSNGATTPMISVTPDSTTIYTVTTDSVGKCSKTDTLIVTVFPLPRVTITGDTNIIMGETAILIASGAERYTWSTGATTNSINISPYITTSYSVIGTDINGCRNSAEATIIVNSNSLTDASELDFNLYPIPVETRLTVECEAIETITVYNLLGKTIEKIDANGENSVVIPVKDYAQGVYVILVSNNKGQTGRKTFIVR